LTLAEAAAVADELAKQGKERELADLRRDWSDEIEEATRSGDYRERAVAYRAIGQLRFRQKAELLRRGLEDDSPACRGSALLSLELLSRDHPREINSVRPLLHTLANADDNARNHQHRKAGRETRSNRCHAPHDHAERDEGRPFALVRACSEERRRHEVAAEKRGREQAALEVR